MGLYLLDPKSKTKQTHYAITIQDVQKLVATQYSEQDGVEDIKVNLSKPEATVIFKDGGEKICKLIRVDKI
jgi:hypothetical protein